MLAVWLERLVALPAGRGDDLSWLGEAERRRCAAFGSDRRRQEYLAGRDLLRRMLAARRLIDDSRPVALSAEGAPRLADRPEVHLSLSHRRGWVAGAVSDAPVGIDVEVEAQRDVAALAGRFCTAREQQHLATLAPADAIAHLHTLWALKEAAYKAAHPAQDAAVPDRLESRPMPDGEGNARSWRWPDGRVLAVSASRFVALEPRGLDGAADPACWDVTPVEPV